MDDDIIDDFLRRLRPLMPLDQWHRTVYELRQTWGGCRVYIRKDPADGAATVIAEKRAAGMSLQDAFAAAGVSRAWGYRLISRKQRG